MATTSLRVDRWVAAMALLPAALVFTANANADGLDEGRELYIKTCTKCHGLVTEDALSWTPEALLQMAVTMPLGPSLTGIYGRQAGVMPNYPYSRAFRGALENPWTWDEDSLDGWLTSSQDFIRGSTMFLKVEDEPRAKIIAYLKTVAQYRGE